MILCLLFLGMILPQSIRAEEEETEPLTSLVGDGTKRVLLMTGNSYSFWGELTTYPFNGTLEGAFVAVGFAKEGTKTNSFVFDGVTVTEALTVVEEAQTILTLKGKNSAKSIVLDQKSSLAIKTEDKATLELTDKKVTLGVDAELVDWSGQVREMEKSSKLFAIAKDSIGFNPDDLSFDVILEVTNEWEEELTYVWQEFENDKWTTIANQTTATYHTNKEKLVRVLISCGESMMVCRLDVKIPDSFLEPLKGNKELAVTITSDRTYKIYDDNGVTTLFFDGSLEDTFKVVHFESIVKSSEFVLRDVVVEEQFYLDTYSFVELSFEGKSKLPLINNHGDLILSAKEGATLKVTGDSLVHGSYGRVTDYTGALKTAKRPGGSLNLLGATNVYNPVEKEHYMTIEASTTLTGKAVSFQWQRQEEKGWTDIKNAIAKSYTATKEGNYRVLVKCIDDILTSYFVAKMDEVDLSPLVGVSNRDVILVRPYTYQYKEELQDSYFNGMLAGTFASVQVENTMENAAYTLNGVTLRDSLSVAASAGELDTYANIAIKGKNSIGDLKVNGVLLLSGEADADITYKKIIVGAKGSLTDYTGLLRDVVIGKDTFSLKDTEVTNYLVKDTCRLLVEATSKEAIPSFAYTWQQKVGNEWKAIEKADTNSLLVKEEGNYRVLVKKDNAILSHHYSVIGNYMGIGSTVTIVGDHALADEVRSYPFNNELTGLFRSITVAPEVSQRIELSLVGSTSVDLLQVQNSAYPTIVRLFDKVTLKKVKVDSRLELYSDGFNPAIAIDLVEMGNGVLLDYSGSIKKIVRGTEEYYPIAPDEEEQMELVEGRAEVSFGISTNNPEVIKWFELQYYNEELKQWFLEDMNSVSQAEINSLRAGETVTLSTSFTVRKRGFYRGMIHTTDDRIHLSTQAAEVTGDEVSIGMIDDNKIQLTVVDGLLSVRLNSASNEPVLLQVFTLSGQMVAHEQLRDEATVALTAGNYIVAIGNKSYKIQVGR